MLDPTQGATSCLQVFTLSRTVRTFGTERREGARYQSWLKRLTHLSIRQAAAYLMYLTTNSGLYYMTKVGWRHGDRHCVMMCMIVAIDSALSIYFA